MMSKTRPGRKSFSVFAALLGLGLLGGCSDNGSGPGGGGTLIGTTEDPGVALELAVSAEAQQEKDRLDSELSKLDDLSAAQLAERFPTTFAAAPSYTAEQIAGLELIQASSLKLNEPQLAALSEHGFVIDQAQRFPSFAHGYETIYMEDLPVYVSADSILGAVHNSYDAILKTLERGALTSELTQLLDGMHARLASGIGKELGAEAVRDADLFLSVARGLLSGKEVAPRAGASEDAVHQLFDLAQKAQGTASIPLFGVTRKDEDFSQFTPRGHYTDTPALERYFRAMMWLGRIDLRLLETQEDGSQLFRRRQVDGMFLLRALIDGELRAHFDGIDRVVSGFVGESDYMVLSEVDALAADLGVDSLDELAAVGDDALAQAIVDGGYGQQRISSHIVVHGFGAPKTLPLSRSFALLGQRYTVDSHVFSNVVYDRIGKRMMPDALDVGFAALQNDQAATLLEPQLSTHEPAGYPAALAKMRLLVDEHPAEFWDESLYTRWLGALRTLSPAATTSAADATSLFPAARSEQWGRRLLNTQLASWAELRHDTILYVKQSYTSGAACEFPDAYVDPYPELYAALVGYGQRGAELVAGLEGSGAVAEDLQKISAHFALVSDVATRLHDMAEHERTGAAFTDEMLAFINDAVMLQPNCDGHGGVFEAGWYKQLFFDPSSALDRSPTIADVHTQPTDEGGNTVGKVLHVGTGTPRAMVVVAETCSGPRAYAGLASSYFEEITDDFRRLDDPTWETLVYDAPDVPWMSDLLVE